jgi:hypothetical protein
MTEKRPRRLGTDAEAVCFTHKEPGYSGQQILHAADVREGQSPGQIVAVLDGGGCPFAHQRSKVRTAMLPSSMRIM